MIVAMSRVNILIYHKVRDRFLSSLQKLGLMHVEVGQVQLAEEKLKSLKDRVNRCQNFLKITKPYGEARVPEFLDHFEENVFTAVEAAEKIHEELDGINNLIEKHKAQLRGLRPWGNFDIVKVHGLKEAGVAARFFIAPAKKYQRFNFSDFTHEVISRDKMYVYFIVFEKGRQIALECDEFFYPDVDQRKLENQCLSLEAVKKDREDSLKHLAARRGEVEAYRRFLISRYAFLDVRDHLEPAAENAVYMMRGWVPRERVEDVEKSLKKEDVYIFFEEPKAGEKVPVLLKNGPFSRLFEPITRMFDLPAYSELDLTVFVAPFFTLFFGLCLGDMGYGLVILLAAGLAKFKWPQKRPLLTLLQVFGGSAFLCGVVQGSFFGFDLALYLGLKHLVILDQDSLFYLALALGLIQVLFGMVLRVVKRTRQGGFLAGLSSMGWIFLVLGLVGMAVSPLSIYAAYLGVFLILFFNDMKRNVFVRFGKGLWDLYGITGIFGDVLSYIRLFALGISSAILGFVINESVAEIIKVPRAGLVLGPLFFVVFHAMNLGLGCLSSFVHPLRLTFVEFYKNAGFQGGGMAFKPFKIIGVRPQHLTKGE